MAINAKKNLKNVNTRNYLAKDFRSFRNELYAHAKMYFADKIQDFSEPSFRRTFARYGCFCWR